jgi:hypothetical protein
MIIFSYEILSYEFISVMNFLIHHEQFCMGCSRISVIIFS